MILNFAHEQYKTMRRYARYCKRYLTKVGLGEKTPMYVDLISRIEWARASLYFFLKINPDTKMCKKFSKEFLDLFSEGVDLFQEVSQNFYQFSMEKTTALLKKQKILIEKTRLLTKRNIADDAIAAQRLEPILHSTLYLTNVTISINLQGIKMN
ncbi:hypothetical protein HZA98_02410 [Candidatus Woesearchaeota archaeon]|nr:hypothetical protein [Candidatus Woesearchaeota archaeon]